MGKYSRINDTSQGILIHVSIELQRILYAYNTAIINVNTAQFYTV